jgi:hypothetical protein
VRSTETHVHCYPAYPTCRTALPNLGQPILHSVDLTAGMTGCGLPGELRRPIC